MSRTGGVTVKDVDQHDFVKALAAHLKKNQSIKPPAWSDLVKLGRFKELSPTDDDWYYTRLASTARHLYIRSPAGVGAFMKIYGGRQRRGTRPSHFCRASGSVARHVLKTLETIKYAEKVSSGEGAKGGRQLTKTGRKNLDTIAYQVAKAKKA